MGNTGKVYSTSGGDGTHLHYQMMGNMNAPESSSKWNLYDSRRNYFLNYIGAPSTKSYVVDQGTETKNNYTTGSSYSNYFYNINNYIKRLGY